MSKATTAPALPTLAEIATVERDLGRCDRTRDLWLARSDTHSHVRYEVVYNKHRDTWECNCPSTVPCKHILRCRVMDAGRWWERQLSEGEFLPAELRTLRPAKQQQIDHDVNALNAFGCILAIDALLAAAGEDADIAA